ncbi:ABC transporter permease [Paenibacillus sp. GCM10023252]|uniref:ABC transporter permease n=1 Tax=Paenibacillus sp. GCM10023252 TaxID=3252649 RepID=UPI00361F9822
MAAAVILLPICYVFTTILTPPGDNWYQVKRYLLKDYLADTLFLTIMSGALTVGLGVSLAWLIAVFDFPGKRLFRTALLLPLAIPPYIAAYTYSTMFSYTGVVQTTLRNHLGIVPNQELITISSMRGAIFIFTMFLFPYVYLITRAYFENQSASYIENARLLGRKPLAVFLLAALPLARPAIIGGASLVVFEVLSDYGVTSYFGIQTITTAIFQTWFGMYDVETAMRLAAWLMLIIIGVFILERLLRGGRAYSATTSKASRLSPIRLKGGRALGAVLFCFTIVSISFLIPVAQLIVWAAWTYESVWDNSFSELIWRTLYVATISSIVIMVLTVIVASVNRSRTGFSYLLSRSITAGYSVPGAIIAIGVLAVFIQLDHTFAPLYQYLGWGEAPLILSLSVYMLLFGYIVRFMATGYQAVETGYEKLGMKYSEASRLLGAGLTRTIIRVDLPMIRGALLTGLILTFVEVCKELPLALLLRPFNFETLAIKAYQYANDEQIHRSAIPSLLIIGISLISVVLLQQVGRRPNR